MAARPNSRRTLEYGHRIAGKHIQRLEDMILMTEKALAENKLLTPAEVQAYKECVKHARKQVTLFQKVETLGVPAVDTATVRRKRGRPSKAELEALGVVKPAKAPKAAKQPKAVKAPKAAKAPKAKATKTAPVEAPKRRGRPKGSKNKPKALAA